MALTRALNSLQNRNCVGSNFAGLSCLRASAGWAARPTQSPHIPRYRIQAPAGGRQVAVSRHEERRQVKRRFVCARLDGCSPRPVSDPDVSADAAANLPEEISVRCLCLCAALPDTVSIANARATILHDAPRESSLSHQATSLAIRLATRRLCWRAIGIGTGAVMRNLPC